MSFGFGCAFSGSVRDFQTPLVQRRLLKRVVEFGSVSRQTVCTWLRDVVSNWRFRRVEPHAWQPQKRDLGQLNACTDRRISNLRNSGG